MKKCFGFMGLLLSAAILSSCEGTTSAKSSRPVETEPITTTTTTTTTTTATTTTMITTTKPDFSNISEHEAMWYAEQYVNERAEKELPKHWGYTAELISFASSQYGGEKKDDNDRVYNEVIFKGHYFEHDEYGNLYDRYNFTWTVKVYHFEDITEEGKPFVYTDRIVRKSS